MEADKYLDFFAVLGEKTKELDEVVESILSNSGQAPNKAFYTTGKTSLESKARTSKEAKVLPPPFSKLFSNIFGNPGEIERAKNQKSWLMLIINSSILTCIESQKVKNKLRDESNLKAIRDLAIKLKVDANDNAVYFVRYLIMLYEKIRDVGVYQDDCLFGYVQEMNFNKIRCVIVGQDPVPGKPSKRFAFHEIPCVTTKNLLTYINNDLAFVDHYQSENPALTRTYEEMKIAKASCSFQGLIEQGVLLINAREKFRLNFWLPVLKFWISNMNEHLLTVVFIFAGEVASKACTYLINKNNHFVMSLCHPNAYPQHSQDPNRSWKVNLPFVNANLHLVKHQKTVIDWGLFEALKPNETVINRRRDKWTRLLTSILSPNMSPLKRPNGVLFSPELKVWPIFQRKYRVKRCSTLFPDFKRAQSLEDFILKSDF